MCVWRTDGVVGETIGGSTSSIQVLRNVGRLWMRSRGIVCSCRKSIGGGYLERSIDVQGQESKGKETAKSQNEEVHNMK